MSVSDTSKLLSHLAIDRLVAGRAQNQALNSIGGFHRDVLKNDPDEFSSFTRPGRPKRLPVVLSRNEVDRPPAHRHDIRTVQKRLGRADNRTPMAFTHVMNNGFAGVVSPLGLLPIAHSNTNLWLQ